MKVRFTLPQKMTSSQASGRWPTVCSANAKAIGHAHLHGGSAKESTCSAAPEERDRLQQMGPCCPKLAQGVRFGLLRAAKMAEGWAQWGQMHLCNPLPAQPAQSGPCWAPRKAQGWTAWAQPGALSLPAQQACHASPANAAEGVSWARWALWLHC